LLCRLFYHHISWTPLFKQNCHITFRALVALEPLVLLMSRLDPCSARISGDRHTHTHTHTHTQTHKPSTVTLAAHARQGLIKQECWHWLTLQSDGLIITSCATHEDVWWPTNWTDGRLTGITAQIFHCQCVEDEVGLIHSTRTSDSRDCYTTARSYVPMWAFPSYINPTSSYSHIHCSIQSDAATQGDAGSSECRGFNTDRRCRNCRYRK